MLQCEAKGEKPIGILWNMNNKRLDTMVDPRYTVREEIVSDGVLSTISIKRSERDDSALFTCVATRKTLFFSLKWRQQEVSTIINFGVMNL